MISREADAVRILPNVTAGHDMMNIPYTLQNLGIFGPLIITLSVATWISVKGRWRRKGGEGCRDGAGSLKRGKSAERKASCS
jgi:hypothetical protein